MLEDMSLFEFPSFWVADGRMTVAVGRDKPVTGGFGVENVEVANEAAGFTVRWNLDRGHG